MENQPLPMKAIDQDLKTHYANNVRLMFTEEEFVLDFTNQFPPVEMLCSRIVINPRHLKRIVKYLEKNLEMYEKQFSEVQAANEPLKAKTIEGFKPNDKKGADNENV